MVTDTQRILRTDPGRPEVCNVCQLQPSFGDDYESLWEGERTARTGCVDMKKLLAGPDRRPLRWGPRALRRADGGTGLRGRDPGGRRGADPPDRRGDDGRGPGEDGPALMSMLNIGSGPRDRRLAERAAHPRRRLPLLRHRQPAVAAVLLLRRHPADVLPGLAAGVHHQPDRQPGSSTRSRACPAPRRRSSSTPRVVVLLVLVVVVAAGALATSIAQFAASDPGHQGAPADDPRAVAGPARTRSGSDQIDLVAQAEAALGNLDQIAGALVAAAPADRGRQPERGRDAADRVLPVDLHGPRPRRRPRLPVPDRAARRTAEEARLLEIVGLALVRRLPARPGADGRRLLPRRAGHEPHPGAAARGPHLGRGRPAPDDPVLRAVHLLDAAGHRRPRPAARVGRPGDHPDGRRLDRGDERPPAADHAGRRRASTRSSSSARSSSAAGSRASRAPSSASRSPRSCSAFVLEFLHRTSGDRSVAGRAARRLEERDGRPVRIPREPTPGSATDIDEPDAPDIEPDPTPPAPRRERRGRRPARTRRDDGARGSAGHDPRACPDRATRPRQGTRRAAGRRCRARRAAGASAQRPAARRVDDASRGSW